MAIIVLNFNNSSDTIDCLESIRRLRDIQDVHVLVVDNGSDVGNWSVLNKWFSTEKTSPLGKHHELSQPNCLPLDSCDSVSKFNAGKNIKFELLSLERNLGYGAGNNRGIDHLWDTDISLFWVINNDVILAGDSFEKLIQSTEPFSALTGFRLLFYDEENGIQSDGGLYNRWLGTTQHLNVGEESCVSSQAKPDYEVGACLLFTRDCLELVGGLVEDHFLFYEEIDLMLRCEKLGLAIDHRTDLSIFHKEGATINPLNKRSEIAEYFGVINRFRTGWRLQKAYFPTIFLGLVFSISKKIVQKDFKLIRNLLFLKFSRMHINPLKNSGLILKGTPTRGKLKKLYKETKLRVT